MNKKKLHIIPFFAILIIFILFSFLAARQINHPEHIAFNIKAERIPLSGNAIKVTWEMNRNFSGDFVVGRSESPFNSIEDILKAKLAGISNPSLEGMITDKNLQHGKEYYYAVIAKEKLLKREIELFKNVNITSAPVSLHAEPDMVKSIKADTRGQGIRIRWDGGSAKNVKYNVYRSRSPINSDSELTVSSKLATVGDSAYTDTTVPEFGAFFYAVSVTDKNDVEYFTPVPGQNFTTIGIFIRDRSISTPLNVAAFAGTEGAIIVRWEKAAASSDREITGYEVFRSGEIINSFFKLKESRLITITDREATAFTDRISDAGDYYYAVLPRYSDGTVDINFDTGLIFTRIPVSIKKPYRITGIKGERNNGKILITWEYTGNEGMQILKVIRAPQVPATTSSIEKMIIGSVNITAGRYQADDPDGNDYHYGLISDMARQEFVIGLNITSRIPALSRKTDIRRIEDETPAPGSKKDTVTESGLNRIIRVYFYSGRYDLASKELNKFISGTDNYSDRALARLFLAKSFIEMKDYSRAILILNSSDVKSAYPDESRFWTEFAMLRLQ